MADLVANTSRFVIPVQMLSVDHKVRGDIFHCFLTILFFVFTIPCLQCPLLCAGNIQTKDGWRIVAGASTGDVYVFSAEKEVCNSFKAHEGPVLALAESGTGGAGPSACCFIVTGGRDRTVKVWNHALSIISSFTLNDIMAPMDGSVAALDVCPILPGSSSSSSAAAADANATRLRIVAGTQGGDIVEIISLARDGGGGHPAGAGLAAAKGISEAATEDVRNKDLSGAESISLLHSHAKGEWKCG